MAKKILVVDNDRDTRLLLQVILRKEGHDVCSAPDGNEALELVGRERPDLVIVDAMMTGLDGYATLKALRAKHSTATLPVVMLSSKTENTGLVRAWRDGVDLYLEKPFDPQDLTAYVRRIFEERRAMDDRRCEVASAERRETERRALALEAAAWESIERRNGDRRTGDRRITSRRLDFAAGEWVDGPIS